MAQTRTRPATPSAFTLVELLVVIAIVAMLVALLIPAIERARAQARITACASNQAQLYVAARAYGVDFGEYPMRITAEHKDEYGNGCARSAVGGGNAAGRWSVKTLAAGGYLADPAGGQCTAVLRQSGAPWTWGHRYDQPWFEFNGPFANGSHVSGSGHANGMGRLGKTFHRNEWCEAPWGVDYNFLNYREPRKGRAWGQAEVALIGCPSVLKDAASYGDKCAFEPHLDQPLAGCGFGHQSSGGRAYRRNYTFADGHTVFVNKDDRPKWSWVP